MTYCHTTEAELAKAKIAVTLDPQTLRRVDRLVRAARYPNRSQAIEAVISAQLDRLERRQLIEECSKLDPAVERSLAEAGLDADLAEWPEYSEARSAGRNAIQPAGMSRQVCAQC